jgi:hypothetical protein
MFIAVNIGSSDFYLSAAQLVYTVSGMSKNSHRK